MNRSPLIVGLAAVFAGLTALLVAAGAATGSVFVLFVSLPLGITAGVMWLHGTGRLSARGRARAAARPGGATGFGNGRASGRRGGRRERTAGSGPFAGRGPFTGDGGRFGRRRRAAGGDRRRAGVAEDGMSAREAADVLGVDPDADDAAVKRAYREQAKRHHPDVEGGDEATFKRVTEAYERLT